MDVRRRVLDERGAPAATATAAGLVVDGTGGGAVVIASASAATTTIIAAAPTTAGRPASSSSSRAAVEKLSLDSIDGIASVGAAKTYRRSPNSLAAGASVFLRPSRAGAAALLAAAAFTAGRRTADPTGATEKWGRRAAAAAAAARVGRNLARFTAPTTAAGDDEPICQLISRGAYVGASAAAISRGAGSSA